MQRLPRSNASRYQDPLRQRVTPDPGLCRVHGRIFFACISLFQAPKMRARPTGRALRGWCAAATPLVLALSFIPHSTTSTPLARLVDPFAARGTLPLNGGGAGGDGARGRALGSAAGLAPLRGGGGSI